MTWKTIMTATRRTLLGNDKWLHPFSIQGCVHTNVVFECFQNRFCLVYRCDPPSTRFKLASTSIVTIQVSFNLYCKLPRLETVWHVNENENARKPCAHCPRVLALGVQRTGSDLFFLFHSGFYFRMSILYSQQKRPKTGTCGLKTLRIR